MMIKERYKLFGIPISGNTITNFVFLLHKEIEKQILEIVRAQHEKDEVITALLLELLIIFSEDRNEVLMRLAKEKKIFIKYETYYFT